MERMEIPRKNIYSEPEDSDDDRTLKVEVVPIDDDDEEVTVDGGDNEEEEEDDEQTTW
jgi:hypothetical protein